MIMVVEAKKSAPSSSVNCKSRPLQALLSDSAEPLPPHAKGKASALEIVNAEATELDRPADAPPVDVAIASISLGAASPKETSLDLLE